MIVIIENPAVKTKDDREAILSGLHKNLIDVIATDHAPHTLEEKSDTYLKSPSGGPLIQISLPLLLQLNHQNKIKLEDIVQKTSHNLSTLFQIKDRGYIREGYYADIVLFDLDAKTKVSEEVIHSKCGWKISLLEISKLTKFESIMHKLSCNLSKLL